MLLIVVFCQALVGCGSSRFPSGELIMFTAVGPHALEARVFVVRPDGSKVTTVLNPKPSSVGYLAAYGNSLKTFILVSADQATSANTDVVNITQYTPRTGKLVPLQQQLPAGEEGSGVPSPDNSQFVAEIGPPGPQLNLWVSDFKTKQYRQLTDGPAQDFNETWSPDGHQIVFTRILPPFPSITSQLMSVPSQGGTPTIIFGTDQHVVESAFSSDGHRLVFNSINGLETMDLASMQRNVLITLDQLNGSPLQRITVGRGLAWAKTQETIVLIMRDISTNRAELWTVASDGSNFRKIYTADDGADIQSVAFVEN
jgi:dipeptidyl aminopeptidase/acylaminoacyl peptidase